MKKCISLSFPSGKLIVMLEGRFSSAMSAECDEASCEGVGPQRLATPYLSECAALQLRASRACPHLQRPPAAAFVCPEVARARRFSGWPRSDGSLISASLTLTEKSFNIVASAGLFAQLPKKSPLGPKLLDTNAHQGIQAAAYTYLVLVFGKCSVWDPRARQTLGQSSFGLSARLPQTTPAATRAAPLTRRTRHPDIPIPGGCACAPSG